MCVDWICGGISHVFWQGGAAYCSVHVCEKSHFVSRSDRVKAQRCRSQRSVNLSM